MKMYIVKYCGGSHEEYSEKDLFVTDDIGFAQDYIDKANKLLDKMKKHVLSYEDEHGWISPEHCLAIKRWGLVRWLREFRFDEVEVRSYSLITE